MNIGLFFLHNILITAKHIDEIYFEKGLMKFVDEIFEEYKDLLLLPIILFLLIFLYSVILFNFLSSALIFVSFTFNFLSFEVALLI